MKKSLAILLAITLCLTISSPVMGGGRDYADYNDANLANVLKDQNEALAELCYEIEANWLNHLGLFDGISSATYQPALDQYATREQAMKLMAVAFGWPVDMNALSGFTDVSPWAEPYVAAAVAQNAINGIGDGLFGAEDPITAHEMLTIVIRSLGYTGPESWTATSNYTERALMLEGYPSLTQDDPLTRDSLVGIIFLTLLKGEAKGEDFTLIEKIAATDPIIEDSATNGGLISRNYKKGANGPDQKLAPIDIGPLFTRISTSALPYHSAIKHLEDIGYVPLSYKIGQQKTYYALTDEQLIGSETLELTYRFGQLTFTMVEGDIALKSMMIDEQGYFSYADLMTGEDLTASEDLVFNGDTINFDTTSRYYADLSLNAYIKTIIGDGINTLVLKPMSD